MKNKLVLTKQILFFIYVCLCPLTTSNADDVKVDAPAFLLTSNITKSRMQILLDANEVPVFPDLAGKIALITGSSRGIGAETARFLAINKVKVVINGRRVQPIQELVDEINNAGGEAIGIAADCTDFVQIEHMRQKIEKELGHVQLLFTFAGGSSKPKSIEEQPLDRWQNILNSNLTSKFLTIKSFVPSMKKNKQGVIIIMSSSAGRSPSDSAYDYSTAQAAIPMLTQNLSQQLGRKGIRVNALAPDSIANDTFKMHVLAEARKSNKTPHNVTKIILDKYNEVGSRYALSRMGHPKDVAAASLFLASEASSWITGIVLDINGGGQLQLKQMGSGI